MAATGRASGTLPSQGSLEQFGSRSDPSWTNQLQPDPETEKYAPNKSSRQVKSGHYVLVKPTPLPKPKLVIYSQAMAQELGLSEDACTSSEFAGFFTGDTEKIPAFDGKTWATPYALSIYGQEMYQNCPFGNGNGYGDGRAVSVAEVKLDNGKRWELQLKGGGRTPFCRGGDGRAVLRSSIREFLVSEAMHNLGVETTRALSLVKSLQEKTQRPWYSNEDHPDVPSEDDPRLAQYPPEMRKALLQQLIERFRNPDQMITETCAITCRVAPSFLRVGHVELHGRRAGSGERTLPEGPAREAARQQLRALVEHALFREYPECREEGKDLQPQVLCMLRAFSQRIANLMAEWVRVGFVQGNFNSDNCLVGGRTMDYGPFGFVQRFEQFWNMWSGGGKHYGFLNQPVAGAKNFGSFLQAVIPLLDKAGVQEARQIFVEHETVSQKAMDDMWRRKLGLTTWTADLDELLQRLLTLMESAEADWTLFWRQLAELPAAGYTGGPENSKEVLLAPFMAPVCDVFYKPLPDDLQVELEQWLREWLQTLQKQGLANGPEVATAMRHTNPKYVPREWMLVQAYDRANFTDNSMVEELHELFADPYGLEPDTKGFEAKYYRKAPAETYEGVGVGGSSYMS
mmetsp:Transcript_44560/g.72670  ORF Transcript_44560/g.72670 Transcript_44560/m.72670 type:complete len:628 (+) Transcript_44560:259-2142(+)